MAEDKNSLLEEIRRSLGLPLSGEQKKESIYKSGGQEDSPSAESAPLTSMPRAEQNYAISNASASGQPAQKPAEYYRPQQAAQKEAPKRETAEEKSDFLNPELNEEAKEEINNVLGDLKKKMSDIDRMTQELDTKRKDVEKVTLTRRTQKMLEEIKVPSLDMLK